MKCLQVIKGLAIRVARNKSNKWVTLKRSHIASFDLKNKKVLFYNIQAKLEEEKEIDIDIFKVQGELKKLENNKMLWTGKKRRRDES